MTHFARTKSDPRRAALGCTQGNNRSDAKEGRRKCRNEAARKHLRPKDSACVRRAAARSAPPGGHVCHWGGTWGGIRRRRRLQASTTYAAVWSGESPREQGISRAHSMFSSCLSVQFM